jgi:hypothetical protein
MKKQEQEPLKCTLKCSESYATLNIITWEIKKAFRFVRGADFKSFIDHLDGLRASIYWAHSLLNILTSFNLWALISYRRCRLISTIRSFIIFFDPIDRTELLQHLVAVLRYLAEGYGRICGGTEVVFIVGCPGEKEAVPP